MILYFNLLLHYNLIYMSEMLYFSVQFLNTLNLHLTYS